MIERLIGKMKQFRALATRYDKLGESFLSAIQLVLSFIKVTSIVNTPQSSCSLTNARLAHASMTDHSD